jgi:6-phosphogluconolactonase
MLKSWTQTLVLALAVATSTASALRAGESSSTHSPGAVYALTNSPAGNAVLVYDRSADGSLLPAASYPTGGTGNGAGLGSQGAVIVSDDGYLLFAVNSGSHSISSFRIRPVVSSWSRPRPRAARHPPASHSAAGCSTC